MTKISYSGYRFPPEIIHQAIWLYLRFTLSLRDVQDLLAERGVLRDGSALGEPFRTCERPQRLVFAKDNEWLIFIRLAQPRAALELFA